MDLNNYLNIYLGVFRKYAEFNGRARREEFWTFTLINIGINIVLNILISIVSGLIAPLAMIYGLAVLIPGLAVSMRRLHDIGKSGWWILIGLIPVLGWIALIYFGVLDSQSGSNQYGPNPKGMGEVPQPTPAPMSTSEGTPPTNTPPSPQA
jgi:uncharacterized membrane protein YhaH (DUF805 family)